jgi:DNA-binding CsgD family transcriptional regulator
VITSDSGFLYYDDIQNTFFALKEINQSLGSFSFNARIIPAVHDYYWIFKEGDCARVRMDENNVIEMDTQVLNDLNEFLIPGYEDVYMIDSTYTIIYLDNGYAVHQNNWENSNSNYHPDIFIRELNFHTSSGETLNKLISLREIPFRYNNIQILISFPDYSRDKKLMYQLSGYNERWVNLKKEGEINFQNLPSGEYTFRITPENGSPYSEVSMNFYIKPVWYQSLTAKIIYVVIFILIFGLIILLNRRKIRKLHEKHRQEQNQLLEIEKAENEKRLAQIRNENLRNEIKLRNSRLAKATFSLIHKNNTLISVKEELMTIKNELGSRFPTRYFNRIIRNVNNDLTSEKDWRMFEQSFSEVHENFLHRLKNEYSDLTPADIQLCAYLKMNLSSKEIASLLNITTRGVEIRRYRLRKKLHMDHDTNLVEFIMNY